MTPTSESPNEIQRLAPNKPPASPTVSELESILEELRREGESVSSIDRDQFVDEDAAVKEFKDSLKGLVEDEEKAEENQEQCEEFEEITGKIWKEQEKQNCEESSRDEMNITFEEHMDRFKKEHREEMEQLRRPRREKQRIANEELQELRRMYERLALQVRMQSEQRLIEKEEKKEDMLKSFENNLNCADSKGEMFAKKIANAQNMFFNAFNNLKTLTDDQDDKLFIKMIMKSLSDQASVCNDVGKELVWVIEEKSKDIRKLDELVSRLDSQEIPTTGWLTKEIVHEKREKDYANIENVPLPEWFRYFM